MVRLPLVLVAFSRRRSSGWGQGGATGSSLCFPVRRLVAVVAAHLSLALVVFLRLGSGWGLRFDVTTASCPVTAAWPLCVGVWSLRLSVSGRPLSDFLRLTVAPTRDRPYIPWSGTAFRRWSSWWGCVFPCWSPGCRLRPSPSCCAYRSVGRKEKTSLVLNHQLFKNSELAQVLRNYVFGRYSQVIS